MKEKIQEIASEVEKEYQMGGLSSGLYFDFAKEVAIRYADWKIKECIKDIEDDIDYDGEIYSTEYRNGQERAIEIIKNK